MTMKNKLQNLRRRAELAESPIGKPLPKPVIDKIVKLAEEHIEYDFIIDSSTGLERKVRFFREHGQKFIFINRHGEEFEFSDEAYPIKHNEMFVGISFLESKKIARVYARF